MKLADPIQYGHLPAPTRSHPVGDTAGECCPECGGRVVHVSDDPTAVRYRCTRCGWDA